MNRTVNRLILSYAMLATACMIWGGSFVFGKIIIREMNAFDMSFWRSAVSAAIFGVYLFFKQENLPNNKREIVNFFMVGCLTVPVTYLLQFGALHYTSASHAAVIIGLEPMTIAFASALLLGTALTKKVFFSSALCFIAVCLLVRPDAHDSTFLGDAMVMISTVVVAFWVVLTKKLLHGYSTVTTTAFITIFGFIAFLPALPYVNLDVQQYHLETWLAILGLALSSSVIGHLLWNKGLKHVPSEQAGLFLSFEPIGGVLLSVLILNEQITGGLIAALILVCAAIVISTCKFKKGYTQAGLPQK